MNSEQTLVFCETMVDFRITDTLSRQNQPPKSPLSGGLRKLRAGQSYW